MPAATFNRDRAVAHQQHIRDFQNQMLRHGADDQCIPSPQQQHNCDLQDSSLFGSPSSIQASATSLTSTSAPTSMDDFTMSMALNEDIELSKFSNASQGGALGMLDFTHMSSANCDANGMPILNAMDNRSNNRPANIEQTQLLSGSRT